MARRLPVWERDVAEAASVSGRGSGHQYEIQLGHLCNERCVFCSSGQLSAMKLARAIPLSAIVGAIEQARAGGARRLTFLGGEPTLHKGLTPALERAVALGFEEIVIFTNGVMLPHPGFVERIAALGRFEWRISIQGGDDASHVAVTKRKDSFARIVEGLRILRRHGQKVTVNVCVNELSYRSLPLYPALVREHGIVQLHVDVIRPASVGDRPEGYLRDIMPRYSEMAPYLQAMLERFEAMDPDFDVNVGNLPYCVLPAWADRIHHGGEPTITRAAEPEALEPEVDKYAWHASQWTHVAACEGCAMRSECTGVFREYLAIHGEDELRPIAAADLEAGREARRRARSLAGGRARVAHLAERLAGRSFGAFRYVALSHRDRPPAAALHLEADDGRSFEVSFALGDTDGRPELRLDDVTLGARTDVEGARTAVEEVLRALRARA